MEMVECFRERLYFKTALCPAFWKLFFAAYLMLLFQKLYLFSTSSLPNEKIVATAQFVSLVRRARSSSSGPTPKYYDLKVEIVWIGPANPNTRGRGQTSINGISSSLFREELEVTLLQSFNHMNKKSHPVCEGLDVMTKASDDSQRSHFRE